MSRKLKMQNALRLTVVEAEAVLAEIDPDRDISDTASHIRALQSATVKLEMAVKQAKVKGRDDGGTFQARLADSKREHEERLRKVSAAEREDRLRNPPALVFPVPGGEA